MFHVSPKHLAIIILIFYNTFNEVKLTDEDDDVLKQWNNSNKHDPNLS